MSEPSLRINERLRSVQSSPDTPLLWVLRDEFGLTGAKFGCGVGLCGACTVVMDGEAVRSCMISVTEAAGRSILTIEGLAERSPDHPLLDAWQRLNVSQCGYCQPGQVMAAFALLAGTPRPSADSVKQVMAGNLCRCGAYPRILAAILDAAEKSA